MSADEPIRIEPTAPPLSRARGEAATPAALPWRERLRQVPRRVAVLVTATSLAIAIAFVFLVLPSHVSTPDAPTAGTSLGPTPTGTPASRQAVAPYRSLELERASAKAREKLGEFVEAQLLLEEEMNVALWGAEEMAGVRDRANEADRLFLEERYEESLTEYEGAVADILALVERGNEVFEEALAEGTEALARRDQTAAEAAFERALAVRATDPRALAGQARAANLPALAAHLLEAQRAELKGDHARAIAMLRKARAVDPTVPGLAERIARAAAAKAKDDYEAVVSAGFAALDAGDFEAAHAVFDRILADSPDDATALAGRQQTGQAQTRAWIDALHASAREHEDAEAWRDALAAYDDALAIDGALEFARQGRERVRRRIEHTSAMQRLLNDPALLSSKREFAAAQELLDAAAEDGDAGAAFERSVADFRELLAQAAEPIPLVLLSDNATDVVILRVAALGAFERHELALRPGRYTIVGSRDGCRDVRKEIRLEAGMEPVDIRCRERI